MNKIAVVVLSDPKSGGDESLGRVFNALVVAYDATQRGDDVTVLFQGAGTRWPELLVDPGHPVHSLFESVRDRVEGLSSGCADAFGARSGAQDHGFPLIAETMVPGTSSLPSIASRIAQGDRVVIF